jgi:hypothetical protein
MQRKIGQCLLAILLGLSHTMAYSDCMLSEQGTIITLCAQRNPGAFRAGWGQFVERPYQTNCLSDDSKALFRISFPALRA